MNADEGGSSTTDGSSNSTGGILSVFGWPACVGGAGRILARPLTLALLYVHKRRPIQSNQSRFFGCCAAAEEAAGRRSIPSWLFPSRRGAGSRPVSYN